MARLQHFLRDVFVIGFLQVGILWGGAGALLLFFLIDDFGKGDGGVASQLIAHFSFWLPVTGAGGLLGGLHYAIRKQKLIH